MTLESRLNTTLARSSTFCTLHIPQIRAQPSTFYIYRSASSSIALTIWVRLRPSPADTTLSTVTRSDLQVEPSIVHPSPRPVSLRKACNMSVNAYGPLGAMY